MTWPAIASRMSPSWTTATTATSQPVGSFVRADFTCKVVQHNRQAAWRVNHARVGEFHRHVESLERSRPAGRQRRCSVISRAGADIALALGSGPGRIGGRELSSTPPRYAIYFVPAAESALYRFGATA